VSRKDSRADPGIVSSRATQKLRRAREIHATGAIHERPTLREMANRLILELFDPERGEAWRRRWRQVCRRKAAARS